MKKLSRRFFCAMLCFIFLLNLLPVYVSAVEPATKEVVTTVDLREYIVFDLSSGDIAIGSTYSGYVYTYNQTISKWELTKVEQVTHKNGDKFYIFQSGTKKSVKLNGDMLTLTSIDIDNQIVIDKTDVESVYNTWEQKAIESGRESTENYIKLTKASMNFDLTIDDIWSKNHVASNKYNENNGGINIPIGDTKNMTVDLKLKGDNRIHYLYYNCGNVSTSGLTVSNGVIDNNAPEGSLTVVGSSDIISSANYSSVYRNGAARNNWNAVIGATDSTDSAYNITFKSGVVYAGAHKTENCTAIGGGGNGTGKINIYGGTVTAVTHSTGTAIGGGIAHTGNGGNGIVTINGGTVYAYNFGLFAYDRVLDTQYGTTDTTVIEASRHVPGTAIGGASSLRANGASSSTITINGGNVYAESLGGAGIGGGNTIVGLGGAATVNINGGEVTSRSTSTEIVFDRKDSNGNTVGTLVKEGVGIGGGSSTYQNGGTATVNINGGKVFSNGIGGGNSIKKLGGDANVTVDAGTIVSTGIGGGYSQDYGYATGSVTINGGSLNSGMAAVPQNKNGEILYMTRISFFHDTETMADQPVDFLTFGVPVSFSCDDIYTDSIGMIYVWLPLDVTVIDGCLDLYGSNINFTPNNEADRDIDSSSVGALIYDSKLPRYTVTIAGGTAYSMYMDEARTEYLSGAAIVEQGVFTYYIQLDKGYELTPYVGTVLDDGSKIITELETHSMVLVDEQKNLYALSVYVQSNLAVWYSIKNNKTGEEMFSFDLTVGDVVIIEEIDGTKTISQSGYVLDSYNGEIFLTSAGFPTNKTVTVKSNKEGNSNISIYADKLNVVASQAVFIVDSGEVNLSFGEQNNMLHSIHGSPIEIKEGAKFNLTVEGKNSIKLSASEGGHPLIVGGGSFNLNNNGGFLTIQDTDAENTGVSQISVGEYTFVGTNGEFSAELYKGDYSYKIVGFLQEEELRGLHESPDVGKMFSARGIYEIFDKAYIESEYFVNNNILTYTLHVLDAKNRIGLYRIVDSNGTDMTVDLSASGMITEDKANGTVTFVIDGNHLKSGNISISAAINDAIPYNIIVHDYIQYDGLAHGITVITDDIFQVYYSDSEIISPDGTKTENILKTDVGHYTVYFFICEKADDPDKDRNYTTVTGSATFTIVKSDNEWQSLLECSNIICGNTPAAHATSKWGTVEYTYYYNDEVINVEDFPSFTNENGKEGEPLEFYVIATVRGNDNYNDLISKKIYFNAVLLSAYAHRGRQLDKITNGETGTLNISSKGAFSVYFSSASIGANSNISIGTELPIGTKITFIVISKENLQYYYHIVEDKDIGGGNTFIPLTKFTLMGSADTKYHPPESSGVEYQFCFEYENLSAGVFPLCLNNRTDSMTNINCEFSWTEQLMTVNSEATEEKVEVSTQKNGLQINVHAKIQGLGYKFLAFKINGNDDLGNRFSLLNTDTALFVNDGGGMLKLSQPIAFTDEFLLFKLGDPSSTIDRVYTLVVSGVDGGIYDLNIEADVRMLESDIFDHYALYGENHNNHVEKTVQVSINGNALITVDGGSHSRVVTSDKEDLLFTIESNQRLNFDGLSATIYQKSQKTYVKVVSLEIPIIAGEVENEGTFEVPAYIVKNIENGTYRIRFEYDSQTYDYNIIVMK